MLRWIPVGVLLLTCAARAHAEEPSKSEQRFMRALVAALAHESNDVSEAAKRGLEFLEDKAAWYLVRELKKLNGAKRAGAEAVLITLGDRTHKAIKELKNPSASVRKSLERVLAELAKEKEKKKAIAKANPKPSPAIAAQVNKILADAPSDSWTSRSPITASLVRLGRGAIPPLLEHLDPKKTQIGSMRPRWAVSALGKLCDRRDLPRLGELFNKGWPLVAGVFEDMDEPACVPYLAQALKRGQLTHEIGSACKKYAANELRQPAVEFLERHGTRIENGTASLLEMLTEQRATEALPAIVAIQRFREQHPDEPTGGINRSYHDRMIGTALARLGNSDGIPLLIPLLGATGSDKWMVTWVGRTLNSVTGKDYYLEGGANDDTHQKYVDWWHKNEGRLKWDEGRRQFVRK